MGREGSRTETHFLILRGALKLTDKGGDMQQFTPMMYVRHRDKKVPLQSAFQRPGVLAGETFRVLHASGLSCGPMVHLGLLLAALSHGSRGPDLGREEASPYHKLSPPPHLCKLLLRWWHNSAGVTLTLVLVRSPRSKAHWFLLCWLCLQQELPGSETGEPEASRRLLKKRVRTKVLSGLH